MFTNQSDNLTIEQEETIMEVDQHGEENHVLRSICVFRDTRLHFEFLNDELQDFAHPKVSIGLSIKEVKCDMDGPNMWHFASVF